MARRLDKTLIDYLVIAISPMLIIVLIASLVYFLLEVFYQGQFGGRLRYIFGLFVAGAVLVARIAIEEDRERASAFAVPLAVATFIVVGRFVDLGALANMAFIALILWCADKLTWDCTVIDETLPDSGEGLMQAVGLDEPVSRKTLLAPPPKVEPEAATTRDASPANFNERVAGWWKRFREHRRRPHAPGLWVVYFSLAALPLFGMGQLLIPVSNAASRQFAFELLFVYVASGLALLLTTSFLGLRRYLRQRHLEMPLLMVNVWLMMGCALIAGVMLFALLLPRPNAEYAVSQMPFRISSPERTSSRYGMGRDGVEENKPWARTDKIDDQGTRQSSQPGDKGQAPSDQQGNQGAGQPGQQQGQQGQQQGQSQSQSGKQDSQNQTPSGKQESPSSSQAGKQGDQGQSPPGTSGKSDSAPARRGSPDPAETADRQVSPEQRRPSVEPVARSGDRPQREGDRPQREGDRPQRETPESQGQQRPADSQSGQEPRREGESRREQSPQESQSKSEAKTESARSGDERSAQEKQQEAEKQEAKNRSSAARPSNGSRPWPKMPQFHVTAVGGWFAALAKLLFYAALIVLIVYGLWRYWPTVLAAIRDFFQACAEFWRSLFGGNRKKAEEAAAPAAPAQPALPRFADFVDPFLSGRAARYTPAQLVTYTFQALEAWAREHGCARQPEETPHEFAQNVGLRSAPLANGAHRLAELYCQIAYASGRLPASSVDQLRQVWQSF